MGRTKYELVTMLESALQEEKEKHAKATPLPTIRAEMLMAVITDAKAGNYHDFESVLVAPKAQLIRDLDTIGGLEGIIKLVKSGEFDDEEPAIDTDTL